MKSPVHDVSLAPRGSAYRTPIVLLTRKKITAAATVLIIVSVKLNTG